MKEIKLTQGKVALVDDEDFEWLNQWKWCAVKHRSNFYAARVANGYNISMHRVILGITDPKIMGDHIDHDGLNNTRSNLRVATNSQNQANRRSKKGSASRFLGVSWFSRDNNWKATIWNDGTNRHLGYYSKEEDAAKAYNAAALRLRGEFANLNKI